MIEIKGELFYDKVGKLIGNGSILINGKTYHEGEIFVSFVENFLQFYEKSKDKEKIQIEKEVDFIKICLEKPCSYKSDAKITIYFITKLMGLDIEIKKEDSYEYSSVSNHFEKVVNFLKQNSDNTKVILENYFSKSFEKEA